MLEVFRNSAIIAATEPSIDLKPKGPSLYSYLYLHHDTPNAVGCLNRASSCKENRSFQDLE